MLSKIDYAFVWEREVVCNVKLEKSGDFHAINRESSVFSQVQRLRSFNADKLYATHHSCTIYEVDNRLKSTSSDQAKSIWTTSRTLYLQITWGTLFQQWRRPDVKDDNHSVHQLMFVFSRRLAQLSRFYRCFDLALLFKKGVGREIAVLEVADTSSIPAILFLNFADDLLRVTSPKRAKAHPASRNFPWRLFLCSLEVNATRYNFVFLDGQSYRVVSRSFFVNCSPVWLPRKTSPTE